MCWRRLCVAAVVASRSFGLRRAAVVRGATAATIAAALGGAAPPARARDCVIVVAGARATIRETLEAYESSRDPTPLRPVAKDLMRPGGSLRICLNEASRLDALDEPTRDHARDAMEYIASVVEFDAFDKLTKDYEPRQSQAYTPAKVNYSLRAFEAADRELNLFAFGLRRAVGG